MPLESPTIKRVAAPGFEDLAIIDSDVHNVAGQQLLPYLSPRWRDYVEMVGRRNGAHGTFGATSTQRGFGACRLDTFPPEGGPPGSGPAFAREQLLDEYGVTAAILSLLDWQGGGNAPAELEVELARAVNDFNLDVWLGSDPRWFASIVIDPDHPDAAVAEMTRCRELSGRFIQVLIGSRSERPIGNPRYWPIYEAAADLGLPVAFHVGTTKYHNWTGVGTGSINYYYELHVGFPLAAQTVAASMVFEGVFGRWPTLKVVLTELGWEWAVPYAWRMDATWRVHRPEVPHLDRKPSEYFGEHFWFTTQPVVEPEHPAQFDELYEQFVHIFGNRLLFSTDYPHWDMDSPFEAIPQRFSRETKRRLLGANASELYGIPLHSPSSLETSR